MSAPSSRAALPIMLPMTRPSQLLHPPRPPVSTLPAATVLLLRDGAQGVEVLMTRRSPQASFAPGAYVFPGGGIDALDASTATHAAADRRPTQGDLHLTQAIAAIRESFEELGILLARHADGPRKGWMADAHDIAAIDRHQPFAAQCAARGLRLAADSVYLLAHWTGDRDLPRRFEVPFLVARMPEGQEPVADETEQFEPVWVRPADALARHEAGQFFMIFPTIRTLQRLAQFASTQAVLDAVAHEQPLWVSCPRAGLLAGKEARYMEDDMPFGELALVCPDGQIVHPLDWQTERPVPLLRNVMRLTAPNPGVMTGPGTNSYLVGDPATGSWPSGMRATRKGTSKRRARSRSAVQWASRYTPSAARRSPRAAHCAANGWWRSMAAMSCASAICPWRGPSAWRASSTPSSSKLSRMAAIAWVRCRSLWVGRRSAAACVAGAASSASMPPPGKT